MSIIIAEAKHMFDTVKPNWVRMLYWDTEVCSDEKYEQHELDNFVKSTKPRGGGGTDVECIPTYLTEKQIRPQAVIVITDGYLSGSWGEWNWPVLWVIIDNKQAKPSVGVCVHISSKEL
jgi:predicted metal-dependent peptidase